MIYSGNCRGNKKSDWGWFKDGGMSVMPANGHYRNRGLGWQDRMPLPDKIGKKQKPINKEYLWFLGFRDEFMDCTENIK